MSNIELQDPVVKCPALCWKLVLPAAAFELRVYMAKCINEFLDQFALWNDQAFWSAVRTRSSATSLVYKMPAQSLFLLFF